MDTLDSTIWKMQKYCPFSLLRKNLMEEKLLELSHLFAGKWRVQGRLDAKRIGKKCLDPLDFCHDKISSLMDVHNRFGLDTRMEWSENDVHK